MANVPVSSGPSEQIRVPEFGTSFKLMDTAGDKVNDEIYQKQLPESGNKLMQAYTDAYDRFSQMRVTDATNAIEKEVNDYLTGEAGALRQEGESVYNGVEGKDGQRKPFAEAHFAEIENIIKKHRGGLDRQQGFRLDDKIASYKERIRGNLINHQMQQIEKHETDTYKTRAQIASDGLMTNITDPTARQEYIDSLIESIGFLYRNAPAETRDFEIKKALSSSLAHGMKSQIDLENLGGARKLLNQYKSQMTGKDAMDIENALKRATKTISERQKLANAYADFLKFDSAPQRFLRLLKDEGIEATSADVAWARGIAGDDPSAIIDALVVGKKVFTESQGKDDYERITDMLGDSRASGASKSDRILRRLTDMQTDKPIDKEQITRDVMSWAERKGIPPELAVSIANKEFARQKKMRWANEIQRDDAFTDAYAIVRNGGNIDTLPQSKREKLDPRDLFGLQKLQVKVAAGRDDGDDMFAHELKSDPERLSKMTRREILREAYRLSSGDLDEILNIHSQVVGKKVKNPTVTSFHRGVNEALTMNGFAKPESDGGKLVFNKVANILATRLRAEWSRTHPTEKDVDPDWLGTKVVEFMNSKFEIPTYWWGSANKTGEELLKGQALSGMLTESDTRLNGILTAGVKASGVSAPEKFHRTGLMVECLIDNDKMYLVSDTQIDAMYRFIEQAYAGDLSKMTASAKRSGIRELTKRQAVFGFIRNIGAKRQEQ